MIVFRRADLPEGTHAMAWDAQDGTSVIFVEASLSVWQARQAIIAAYAAQRGQRRTAVVLPVALAFLAARLRGRWKETAAVGGAVTVTVVAAAAAIMLLGNVSEPGSLDMTTPSYPERPAVTLAPRPVAATVPPTPLPTIIERQQPPVTHPLATALPPPQAPPPEPPGTVIVPERELAPPPSQAPAPPEVPGTVTPIEPEPEPEPPSPPPPEPEPEPSLPEPLPEPEPTPERSRPPLKSGPPPVDPLPPLRDGVKPPVDTPPVEPLPPGKPAMP
jgi:hypothetical protein